MVENGKKRQDHHGNIESLVDNYFYSFPMTKLKNKKSSRKKTYQNRLGSGCLALFGLPFAGVSVFMGWMLGSVLWLGWESGSWDIVPAKIIQVELDESRNDGSSTYRVIADYRYQYQGKWYDANRVGLSEEKDNFGAYHRDLYERLNQAKQNDKTVDCYVDKQNPNRSLLDRQIRPVTIAFMLPFVFGFGTIGFGLIVGSIYASRKLADIAKLAEAEPDRPWLWRDDWKQGVIESTANQKLMFIGIFSMLWSIVAFPIAFLMFSDAEDKPWWTVLLVMIFPTIGVGLIAYFIHLLLRSKKFGASTLRLGHTPGVIGGKLTGVVMAPNKIFDAKSIKTKLVCLQSVKSGDNTREEVLWEDSRLLKQTLSSEEVGRVGVPIVFTIPSSCMSTSEEDRITWKLRVQAKTAGINYNEEFEVPVFRTEDSQEAIEIDDQPLSPYEQVLPLNQLLAEQGIVVESLGSQDSIRYASPVGRGLGASIGLTLFSLIWIGSIVFMYFEEVWFFFAIFSLFGLLIFYLTVDSWLGCSELSIRGHQWKVRSGWFGFRGNGTEFTTADLKSINANQRSSTASGTDQTRWKNLVAQLVDSKQVTLVRHVQSGASERQLLADLRSRAGLDEEGVTRSQSDESGLWDYVN